MRKVFLLSTFFALTVSFQNCSPVQVNDLSSLDAEAAGVADGLASHLESFKVSTDSHDVSLDMMWVVDNSGSMNEEVNLVRQNFAAFLTEINLRSDFRFLLVSQEYPLPNGLGIPTGFNPDSHRHAKLIVGSTNGPEVLLNALNQSQTQGYFRPGAKKVIVFVTDDNSRTSGQTFLNSLRSIQGWEHSDVSVFSFIALSAAESPCLARIGEVYKGLALGTGGKTYNICQTDWSPAFGDILDSSIVKAIRRFTVTKVSSISQIDSVRVDGVLLAPNLYSFLGNTLTLADSVELAENSDVEVLYK